MENTAQSNYRGCLIAWSFFSEWVGKAMNWQIDDVPIFAAVVERNGISAAARHLGISKSTVSKALARLEKGLGLKLVERNPRDLRVTSEGQAFYRRAQRILDEVAEANSIMSGLGGAPAGRVTVSMPFAFSREILSPRLADFHQRYPNISVEIIACIRPEDRIGSQADIAVVTGTVAGSDLALRTLCEGRLIWVCAPQYAAKLAPDLSVESLLPHVRVCEDSYARRMMVLVDGVRRRIDLSRETTAISDPVSVRNVLQHGGGVSFLPEWYCRAALQDGRLVQVCPHIAFEDKAAALSAVYPSRRRVPARVGALLDFLAEICAAL